MVQLQNFFIAGHSVQEVAMESTVKVIRFPHVMGTANVYEGTMYRLLLQKIWCELK